MQRLASADGGVMTLRKEFIFTVVCDSCGEAHHRPEFQSAMETRVSAGASGAWLRRVRAHYYREDAA